MKTYTERPKRGNAKKAWDYMCQWNNGHGPIEMFYSRDHIEGPRWVGRYPSGCSVGPYGAVSSSNFTEIESCNILKNTEENQEGRQREF
jgi:hypothetical protein